MKNENNNVGIWFVVIGVIVVMLLISFLLKSPFPQTKPNTIIVPSSQTTDNTKTVIKETEKEVLVTPEITPTATATVSPSPIK